MASFNKVILMGNLTRDPELRVTQQGTSICRFSIAVNRQFKVGEGTPREETTFIDIDAFGKQAELIAKYLSKGRPIFVEGRLKTDQWETQSGDKRSKLMVVLEGFQFIDPRSWDEGAPTEQTGAAESGRPPSGFVEDLSRGKAKRGKPPDANVQIDGDVPF
jgi:single-strand DNA-binding protein